LKLPLKCRWKTSSGTQKAELFKSAEIAVKVPLEDIQRHSKGRNDQNSWYCC